MNASDFVLGTRESALLFGGAAVLVLVAFVAARVLQARRHGFSIRLQLFLAVAGTTLLTTGLIGLWVIERLNDQAEVLMHVDVSSPRALAGFLRETSPKVAVLMGLLGVAAAVAAFALGRGVAQPIEALARAAEDIARGERQAVLPPPVGREVRRLTAAFESMRRALGEQHQMERFVADLSHELKNPVAAIRAATEVLQEGAADDPEARDRFIGRIDEASRRLEVLLQDLLSLARLESGGVAPDAQPVALDQTIRASISAHADRLEARALTTSLSLDAVRAPGSARWLRRAIDNLLTNAIRYSPEGGVLRLTLTVEGSQAVFHIADQGAGVAPAMKDRLFERFVSDRSERGGTGLGLAIVRSVAEHHGGSARLVSSDAGAVFEMRVLSATTRRGATTTTPQAPPRS